MKQFLFTILFALLLAGNTSVYGQSGSVQEIEQRLRTDVWVLAADSFLGREAGSQGELLARNYIISRFKQLQLGFLPGTNQYEQFFNFFDHYDLGKNHLTINGKKLVFQRDYQIIGIEKKKGEHYYQYISSRGKYVGEGIVDETTKRNDYGVQSVERRFLAVDLKVDTFIPRQLVADMKYRIQTAQQHKAAGIIFLVSGKNITFNKLQFNFDSLRIPVIVTDKNRFTKKKRFSVKLEESYTSVMKKGCNVIGYLDNHSATTIVVGAHYDHLGSKEDSKKMQTLIYNGADDNASGTATVLELARQLKNTSGLRHNYIFILFSAEEKGLYGSTHFVKNLAHNRKGIVCYLNFDMLGRSDSMKRNLSLMATGSSPAWDTLLNNANSWQLSLNLVQGGTGGSDQMPFYLDSIPVVFFFTGLHTDYHQPTDDREKINYRGQALITEYALNVIHRLEKVDNLPFSNVKESGRSRRTQGVSLGIIPEHTWEGKGIKAAGIMEDRPAQKAGLQKNDIVIKIGEEEISDINSYMKALENFKPGDKTKVEVLRGQEKILFEIQF